MNSAANITVMLASLMLCAGCIRPAGTPTTAKPATNPVAAAQPALTETLWQLIAIDSTVVTLPEDHRPPDLQLTGNPAIAEGYSGCNQFSGSWQMTNDTIAFGPTAMTMMACIDGMDIEQRYMQALSKPVRFAIDGDQLRFYSGSTELLAFRATR